MRPHNTRARTIQKPAAQTAHPLVYSAPSHPAVTHTTPNHAPTPRAAAAGPGRELPPIQSAPSHPAVHHPHHALLLRSQALVRVVSSLMRRSVKRKAGFDICDVAPLDAVGGSVVPAVFGHATGDSFINVSHSGAALGGRGAPPTGGPSRLPPTRAATAAAAAAASYAVLPLASNGAHEHALFRRRFRRPLPRTPGVCWKPTYGICQTIDILQPL
jgi:hypothetical protein